MKQPDCNASHVVLRCEGPKGLKAAAPWNMVSPAILFSELRAGVEHRITTLFRF
jgi:hypothetical protein